VTANGGSIADLLRFLTRLKDAQIHYALSDPTEGAVLVEVSVPGERWEVEFHDDGRVSVEIFVSKGVQSDEILEELFRRFSD
jgi:hypothetical protein